MLSFDPILSDSDQAELLTEKDGERIIRFKADHAQKISANINNEEIIFIKKNEIWEGKLPPKTQFKKTDENSAKIE